MKIRLTGQEKKLCNQMVALCDRFLARELDLKSLVTGLEGLLNAGDFGDKDLRDHWYSLWLPLEIRNATGETDWSEDAAREVDKLRSHIQDEFIGE